jgi:hypothetical protein
MSFSLLHSFLDHWSPCKMNGSPMLLSLKGRVSFCRHSLIDNSNTMNQFLDFS